MVAINCGLRQDISLHTKWSGERLAISAWPALSRLRRDVGPCGPGILAAQSRQLKAFPYDGIPEWRVALPRVTRHRRVHGG